MKPDITVAVCTRNPQADPLARTLRGLGLQSLPHDAWEFVLVDNGSAQPPDIDTARIAHPVARVVNEPSAGLTFARLAAIREMRGAVLVFVDDDNVLAPDYLAQALVISRDWPELGAWGGQIFAEFQSPPPDWLNRWENWLAIRKVDRPTWSNQPLHSPTTPMGAGMCVRRVVAKAYAAALSDSPLRRSLGRKGRSLAGSEDTDLAYTAYDLGLGCGLFPELTLTHLISQGRCELTYFKRLVESLSFSSVLLTTARTGQVDAPTWPQLLLKHYQLWKSGGVHATLERAKLRGLCRGRREARKILQAGGVR